MKKLLMLVVCLYLTGCSWGVASLIPASDVCPNGRDGITGQCR
ncbi:MAG: hypothetical protein E7H57_18975 [Pantoea sp.]|nr:hypothetical protein [Pantoea sp.]